MSLMKINLRGLMQAQNGVGLMICLVIIWAVIAFPIIARAQSVSNRLQIVDQSSFKWHVDTGYFLPKEGDLNGGPMFGIGMKYKRGGDTVFGELFYAYTGMSVNHATIESVDNIVIQGGLMTGLETWENARIGAGLQIQQMRLGAGGNKTRITVLVLTEYDISNRWTLRLQSSQSIRNDNIKFGSVLAAVQRGL